MTTMERGLRGIDAGSAARYTTMILGAWFFMSALIWRHAVALGSLDWILGLVVVSLSALAIRQPRLHWAVAGMGAWILIQSAFLPHQLEATVWNERVVGALVLLLGLVPGGAVPSEDV
jgi:hypothetical protein